jgi:hypothetical protein
MLKKIIQLALIGIVTILLIIPTANISAQNPAPTEFWVDSFQDFPDVAQNSVCSASLPTGGPCTLRAALHEANLCDENTCPGGVIIHVPTGTYTLTIPPATVENDLATGDLDVISLSNVQITIEGDLIDPPVIDANSLDRVFDISGESVVLRNLVITGGYLVHSDPIASTTGAGIRNSASALELSGIVLEDNHIICVISNCSQAIGGGIINYGALTINMSTLDFNTAPRGGGIFQSGGAPEIKIYNSTLMNNQAEIGSGGALNSFSQVSMMNVTISNNAGVTIGGIANNAPAILNLSNVTIAGNSSDQTFSSNLYNTGTVNIRNSIIAYPVGPAGVPNCLNLAGKAGIWNSSGYNLYSDTSCPVTGTGDLSNTDPKLSALGYWGGWNWTRGLLAGSPAHDRRPGFCTEFGTGYTVTSDQRGWNRDALCDIGAFEGIIGLLFLPVIKR